MKTFTAWRKSAPDSSELLERCQTAVQAITPDATLILYGSRARGTASLDSDYDLLILVEQLTQQLEDQLGDQLYTLELEYGVILSTLVYERHVWDSPLSKAMPLHQSIEQEGVLV